MKKLLIISCLLVALLPLPAQLAGQSRDPFKDRYGLIAERDIFAKDRRRPYSRPSDSSSSRPSNPSFTQRSPEQSLVLTGIVIEEGEWRAYFENLSAGSIIKARVGDPMARGHITDMQIDAVEYTQGLQSTWVEIGRDLTGVRVVAAPVTVPGSEATAGGSATQPSGTAATGLDPNEPGIDIVERMRRRRLQQGGK